MRCVDINSIQTNMAGSKIKIKIITYNWIVCAAIMYMQISQKCMSIFSVIRKTNYFQKS